tara:strand:+ start:113 stop:349 length:237 start_codon:yes stop_codon:yes gene_type:complete
MVAKKLYFNYPMKKNIRFIIFIILGIIALYFTRVNYGDHSINKSIMACVIAQKNKDSNMSKQQAEKYCKEEISKKINK